MKPEPASPEFKKEPNITNIDTIDTETPVNGPHNPPSAIVSVPKSYLKAVLDDQTHQVYVLQKLHIITLKTYNRQRPSY